MALSKVQSLSSNFLTFGQSNQLADILKTVLVFVAKRFYTQVIIDEQNEPLLFEWMKKRLSELHTPTILEANFNRRQNIRSAQISYLPTVNSAFFWFDWRPVFCQQLKIANPQASFNDLKTIVITSLGSTAVKFVNSCAEELQMSIDATKVQIFKQGVYQNFIKHSDRKPYSWVATNQIFNPRPPFLEDLELENLLDDINSFLKQKELYAQRGIPYRRGYLFYGPPGTGKTTLIRYLASQIDYNICLARDMRVVEVIPDAPERSMLVFEDLDKMLFSNPANSSSNSKMADFTSMSSFINCIDGIEVDEGRIFVATCNNIELLAGSLIRAGRFDYKLELGYAKEKQMAAIYDKFYPGKDPKEFVDIILNSGLQVTPADIQSLLTQINNISSPEDILAFLRKEHELRQNSRIDSMN